MKTQYIIHVLALSAAASYAQDALFQTEFQTPSGNIVCGGGESLSCYVKERNGDPALPRPKDCPLDWGGFFHLPAEGKTEMKCVGDYPFSAKPAVLAYNETVKNENWQCTSRQDGLYCTNLQHHGFLLNRQEQILF